LAAQIQTSGELNPLIVGVDRNGPFIVEGSHRYDALKILNKKSIPAVVVLDLDEIEPKIAKKAGQTVSGVTVAQHILDTSTRFGDSRPFLTDINEAYQLMGLDPKSGANAKYELRDVPLDLLTAGDDYSPAVAKQYAELGTAFPAIVLDSYPTNSVFSGTILDGNHRVAAAKLRGDKTIQAYIPASRTSFPRKDDTDIDELYDGLKTSTHKQTPMSDTEFNNPTDGEGTNAYALQPEKVKGTEAMPPLEVLAPQLFEKESSDDAWYDSVSSYVEGRDAAAYEILQEY
jgi:hypothetical protein